jgi:hypothetical protein
MYEAIAKVVNTCGDAAPGWVARLLRQATPLSTKDTVARTAAWSLLDRRLTDSVRVLALDQTQTTERRRYFLRLLARYVSPIAAVDDRHINDDPSPSVILAAQDADGVLGTWPPNAESRNRARGTIHQMGETDPDATLRKLAALVYDELQYYLP